MEVLRASHLGMCFGVRRAIAMALEAAAHGPLTILGDLVHNEVVLERLRARGIGVARSIEEVETPNVMITAHGMSRRRVAAVRERGLQVFDATCPLVRVAHRTVAFLSRDGYHPIIVGNRDHVEVLGLTEDLPHFDVVLTEQDVDRLTPWPRIGVAAQTTQPLERVHRVVAAIRRQFPQSEVLLADTVCVPTKLRQQAAIDLAARCDLVVVIGGSHSNNTRELAATCGRCCGRVVRVRGAGDLQADWFDGVRTVGITAGTSTPDDVVEEVEERVREFGKGRAAA